MNVSFVKSDASVVDAEIVSETPRPQTVSPSEGGPAGAVTESAPATIVETVVVNTPVEGVKVECVKVECVKVECVNTAAPTPTTSAAPAVVVNVAPAACIPTAPAPAAVAVVAPAPLPVATNDPTALDDENIGFEDVILPRLNIVQKVGDLSNIFNGGEIILNQQTVVHEPAFIHPTDPTKNTPGTGPLLLTVLGFRRRQFAEKVEGGKLGILLNNEVDIAKHNGTLDYKEWQASLDAAKLPGGLPAKKYFQRLATALTLVQRPAHIPDEDHILFPYECEGAYYALALLAMKGVSYTHGAKIMFTARKIGHLRTGYTAQQWSLTSKLEAFGTNFAYVPVLKPAAKNSAAFTKFARECIGAGN